jgi:hypothetical protein
VIVAEASKVTIYDGDDPSLPMWMVFNSFARYLPGSFAVNSVYALNGEIACGGNSTFDGLAVIRFPSDSGQNYRAANNDIIIDGGISGRNDSVSTVTKASGSIVNEIVNDVAMTVLPDAPTDPATGLPVPTIACLVAETEVLMADGSTKRLDQVQPGEMVKTLEGEHRVLNWWDQGIKDVIELEFEGRHKITCTADHKIRTTTGWVEAGDLTEDHEVVVA